MGLALLLQPVIGLHAARIALAAQHEEHCMADGPAAQHNTCCPMGQPCDSAAGCTAWCTMGCGAASMGAPLPRVWTVGEVHEAVPSAVTQPTAPSRPIPPPERPPRA
ncbi:MAG TPA: hypothetical protein ENK62_05705 [Chromatiales bacterium]|nr:hypothetical protein [Chromatiales bacterium]